jgi:hypothetical protein
MLRGTGPRRYSGRSICPVRVRVAEIFLVYQRLEWVANHSSG